MGFLYIRKNTNHQLIALIVTERVVFVRVISLSSYAFLLDWRNIIVILVKFFIFLNFCKCSALLRLLDISPFSPDLVLKLFTELELNN